MLGVVAVAYVTVLFAELLGDKSIYTISSLCTRFRLAHVFAGISVAFGAKMAVAVLAGRAVARFPAGVIAAVSSAMFLATAILLWRRKDHAGSDGNVPAGWRRATAVSFGAVFFTEWADVGQLTAAAVTARFGHPLLVWNGVTAAMMTKGLAAVALGSALRRWFSEKSLRYVAFSLCLLMAVLAATRVEL
jgi:putative Ca2+/H+ antiporter (TMEM165/GDT1 family)